MKPLFKNDAARDTVLAWYDRFRGHLKTATTAREVETRFGRTHVLSAGPEGAPDLVLLHGALASSAHLLGELEPLARDFRVHAVDIVGQSVKSEARRLGTANDDHGQWLAEVLDALGLGEVYLLGVSWGGFAALRFTAVAPARVRKLVLMVPAGVVKGPFWRGFRRMGWPLTRYLMKPTEARRDKLMEGLLTTPGAAWSGYLGDAFKSYNLAFNVPRLARPEEFAAYTNPTFIVAADNDVSFPGEALIKRARALFSGPVEAELLKDCNHSPPTTDAFRAEMSERVRAFLLG